MSAITISGFTAPKVYFDKDVYAIRDAAVAEARTITKVESNGDLAIAGDTLNTCRRLAADVEKGRVAAKDPVLKLGREIDDTAKAFVLELNREVQRLGSLVTGYHARIEEAARQAQIARQREMDRIAAEQRAAEEKARQEAKAAQTDAQLEKAMEAKEAAKVEAAQQAKAVAAVPQPPPKVAGIAVKSVWKFEVTNIDELHKYNPVLVALTPKNREINAAIADGARNIPGLRIWEEKEVRGTR